MDRVWGDVVPQRVRGALYTYLSRLRHALAAAGVDPLGMPRQQVPHDLYARTAAYRSGPGRWDRLSSSDGPTAVVYCLTHRAIGAHSPW